MPRGSTTVGNAFVRQHTMAQIAARRVDRVVPEAKGLVAPNASGWSGGGAGLQL